MISISHWGLFGPETDFEFIQYAYWETRAVRGGVTVLEGPGDGPFTIPFGLTNRLKGISMKRILTLLVALWVTPVLAQSYPLGAFPITASSIGTTGATAATLPATANLTNYLCGLAIRANATAAITGNATVTGTINGTMNFAQFIAPAASGIGTIELRFLPCIPGNSINTAITVNSIAPGAGGIVSVTAWGFQLR